MAQSQQQLTKVEPDAVKQFRVHLNQMQPQFRMVLPPSISPEKFTRVVMTAMQNNVRLWQCDWPSIFSACLKAAEDGLLPDGRQACIVPFNDEDEDRRKIKRAVYIPMIAGLRNKIRQSGEIADLRVEVVHEGDEFEFEKGDEPFIRHRPRGAGKRTDPITHVYSIAEFKAGGLSRHVMTIGEVTEIRDRYARSKKGPWGDEIAFQEMVKKTCAKQHAKLLPMSTEVERVFARDDVLYDLERRRERPEAIQQRQSENIGAAFDRFAAPEDEPKQLEQNQAGQEPPGDEGDSPPQSDQQGSPSQQGPVAAAGAAAGSAGKRKGKEDGPRTPEAYADFAGAVIMQATDAKVLNDWWHSAEQRTLRGNCGFIGEAFERMNQVVKETCEKLGKPAARPFPGDQGQA